MSEVIYFDTSALAKWYINETRSDDVESYIQKHGPVAISDLTIVEMRCLLARRRREKNLTVDTESEVFATFQEDVRRRFLICHPFPADLAAGAVNLMSFLSGIPVRTLDAMHLVIAKEIGVDLLATSDRIMAEAAEALSLKVALF
jgi:predicted nucleic acid-binding protein